MSCVNKQGAKFLFLSRFQSVILFFIMANDELANLIRNEQSAPFNDRAKAAAEKTERLDLRNAQLRACDLRKFDLRRADLSGAYLRLADMRGLDLSEALLEGASLRDAKISGVLFPKNIRAEEIQVSVLYGTRLRTHP